MRKLLMLGAVAFALTACGATLNVVQPTWTSNLAWTASFGSGTDATPIVFPAAGAVATVSFVEGCGGAGVYGCPALTSDPLFMLTAPTSCTSFIINAGLHPIDPPPSNTVTAQSHGSYTLTATALDSRFPPVTIIATY